VSRLPGVLFLVRRVRRVRRGVVTRAHMVPGAVVHTAPVVRFLDSGALQVYDGRRTVTYASP
jgi:hypothetical protein